MKDNNPIARVLNCHKCGRFFAVYHKWLKKYRTKYWPNECYRHGTRLKERYTLKATKS